MPTLASANIASERRGPSRSANQPPNRLPKPRPARNAATTVVVEARSTPECSEMTRCHTTCRTSAEKPVIAKIGPSDTANRRCTGRDSGTVAARLGVMDGYDEGTYGRGFADV